MEIISLAGEWRAVEFDKPFIVPGSAAENEIGTVQREFEEMSAEALRCLRQRYNYTGTLTLTREFRVPESFAGKHLTLFLERVNIASEVWIDDEKIGGKTIEITTPHTYDLTGRLSTGTHKITLKLDNSDLLNIGNLASGYSHDTQGIWLGVIGRAELQCREIFHISHMSLFPDTNSVRADLVINSDCRGLRDRRDVKIKLSAVSPGGNILPELETTAILCNRRQIVHITYPLGDDVEYWSEFNPVLYTMNAVLEYGDTKSECSERFGMRTVCVRDKRICVNNRPISLRGTTDSALYPLTGYPPADVKTWKTVMNTLKEYGLNHIRFHAWCPPDAAFTAADEVGIYICAEMPLWLNYDVCELDTGADVGHESYYLNEALKISETYGNHPSFIMFSNGNELLGDFAMLEKITTIVKSTDNRRLYTLTSNFEHTMAPCEDYLCAVTANEKRIRVQVFHDEVSEHTCLTYDDAVNGAKVPVISFEVGQYCMYPNVDSASDFTGTLMPCNFNILKKDMTEKNIYKKLDKYLKASGAMAALYYKEECEAALRTHNLNGFQLLALTDHTGQGTSTVGLLDVFWKSKGIVTPEQFRSFCSETVPLMKAKRFYSNTDTFTAELDLYDYSDNQSWDTKYTLKFFDGDKCIKEIETDKNTVSCPLSFVKESTKLRVTLNAKGHENKWNIFVYANGDTKYDCVVLDGIDGFDEAVKTGKNIIVNASADNLKNAFKGQFNPPFWSPAFFKSDRTCGYWCDNSHPIFKYFPTDMCVDFQWKNPINNSASVDISSFGDGFETLVEAVPNFFDNVPRSPLFEVVVRDTKVLFNGFNLEYDHITVKALKNSIYAYASSAEFAPKQRMTENEFKALFKS